MSWQAQAWAWAVDSVDAMERLVLLAYAMYADPIGAKIYPATGTVAEHTKLARPSVIRIRDRLVAKGLMVRTGCQRGRGGCEVFAMPIDMKMVAASHERVAESYRSQVPEFTESVTSASESVTLASKRVTLKPKKESPRDTRTLEDSNPRRTLEEPESLSLARKKNLKPLFVDEDEPTESGIGPESVKPTASAAAPPPPTPPPSPQAGLPLGEANTHDGEASKASATDWKRDVEFLAFWKLYPRKEAPRAAWKAFRGARKRANLEAILEGVRRFPFSADRQFQKLPGTWLNADCWESVEQSLPPTVEARPASSSRADNSRWLREQLGEAIGRLRQPPPPDPGPISDGKVA